MKSELCVRATRDIKAGEWIEALEGALARLSADGERSLTSSRRAGYGNRRDFSVVQVYGMPHGMLFLGPARFVNVSYWLIFLTALWRGRSLSPNQFSSPY